MIEKEYPEDFYELKNNVKKLLDFNTEQYKNTYLGRRFNSRLRVYKLDTYSQYWDILRKDKTEQEKLLKELTINVTEFFRDNSAYQVFMDQVVPMVFENKKNGKIKVWSAGSSDGKEAYSIAMIFSEFLKNKDVSSKVEIIGTDIDMDCLNNARNGIYISKPGISQTDIEKQFTFLKNAYKYFEKENNIYRAKPDIKKITSFQYHDLISGVKKHGFDIIFCRNVVIYFTRELQKVLYKDFYNALNPGGFFIMGKTETLVGESRDFFKSYDSKERIYIKEYLNTKY